MRTVKPIAGVSGNGSGEERNPAPPPYASALARELRRTVRGDVDFGRGARALYAYDASLYRQVPVGVVVPRDADNVVAALAACREHGAPVLGRGTGSSLAGQSVNEAVVFDFSRYMTSILNVDPARGRRGRSPAWSATTSGTRPRNTR